MTSNVDLCKKIVEHRLEEKKLWSDCFVAIMTAVDNSAHRVIDIDTRNIKYVFRNDVGNYFVSFFKDKVKLSYMNLDELHDILCSINTGKKNNG